MKKWLAFIRTHVVILVLGSIIGLLALIAVHLLPTQPMKEHVYWSLETIEKEFTDEVLIDGYRATLTGNFTDCLMLEHAVYSHEKHSVLEQVLHMYRSETFYDENYEDGWWPGQSLKDYLTNVEQPREVTYGRYWHGYLVILKPLLWLTSFNTIRLLNGAIQLVLVGFVVVEFCRKGAYSFAKAFMVSLPFLFFVSTYASLSLSICLYIMLAALLVQLKWDKYFEQRNWYMYFFLITGMVTSYFDFLTYPLVTLGYPLCVYFYFRQEKTTQNIKKMVIYSLEWIVGYGGMWATKWILADLLTDSSIIKNALFTVFVRSQSADNQTRFAGFFKVVSANMQVYANWGYLLIIFALAIYFLMKIMKIGVKQIIGNISGCIIFFGIALYPFAWLFVMQNHSEQHWQFTSRILSVAVFAGVTGLLRMVEGKTTKID